MAPDDLALNNLRKWHDVELQRGGSVRDVTKVRFFLGAHGPFDHTFDRTASDSDIENAVQVERRSLERLTRT